jgi:hypothetical protein
MEGGVLITNRGIIKIIAVIIIISIIIISVLAIITIIVIIKPIKTTCLCNDNLSYVIDCTPGTEEGSQECSNIEGIRKELKGILKELSEESKKALSLLPTIVPKIPDIILPKIQKIRIPRINNIDEHVINNLNYSCPISF